MIKISIIYKTKDNRFNTLDLWVPGLPRVGDQIDHDPSGVRGEVADVCFHWYDDEALEVIVRLK